jgi:hypothetical protein
MKLHRFFFSFIFITLLTVGCSFGGQFAATPNSPTQSQLLETPVQIATETSAVAEHTGETPTTLPGLEDSIGYAINLVMGTKARESVYPSYHIDLNLSNPILSDDKTKVVERKLLLSADVEGKNVHLLYTPDGEPTREGFIVSEQEYKIADGKPQETIGQITLSWVSWPLQAWGYNAAVQFSDQTGSETYEGRPAFVYTVDTSKYNADKLKTMIEMGIYPITGATGKVWIDQQTKGLLKARIDYKTDVRDTETDKVVGSGDGNIEITLSKIGGVHVNQP